MPVTIYDIAQEAQVSVKTVSRAINDHPDVSAATRRRVQEIAQRLGFQPNAMARNLRQGKSGMLGLLIPDINAYYAEYAHHMQVVARGTDAMLVIAHDERDTQQLLRNIQVFIARRVDGLIWMSGTMLPEAFELIQSAKIPTVVYNEPIAPDVPFVRTLPDSYAQATYAAVAHLIGQGHQRIAYLTQPPQWLTIHERIQAFHHAIADHHIPATQAQVQSNALMSTDKLAGGYEAMRTLLASDFRPTAVCTSSDLAAIGIMRAARDAGLRIPDDISIIGCDDIREANYLEPPLTTIHTPFAAASVAALSLLRHLMEPDTTDEPNLDLTHSLVIRGSTGPAPRA